MAAASSSSCASAGSEAWAAATTAGGRSPARIRSPSQRVAARSRAFSSSRTLPGQAWAHRKPFARLEMINGPFSARVDFALQEMGNQQGDIVPALAQAGQLDRNYIQR